MLRTRRPKRRKISGRTSLRGHRRRLWEATPATLIRVRRNNRLLLRVRMLMSLLLLLPLSHRRRGQLMHRMLLQKGIRPILVLRSAPMSIIASLSNIHGETSLLSVISLLLLSFFGRLGVRFVLFQRSIILKLLSRTKTCCAT